MERLLVFCKGLGAGCIFNACEYRRRKKQRRKSLEELRGNSTMACNFVLHLLGKTTTGNGTTYCYDDTVRLIGDRF
jgi:hypothetical protein